MKTVAITEFKRNASGIMDLVEQAETFHAPRAPPRGDLVFEWRDCPSDHEMELTIRAIRVIRGHTLMAAENCRR